MKKLALIMSFSVVCSVYCGACDNIKTVSDINPFDIDLTPTMPPHKPLKELNRINKNCTFYPGKEQMLTDKPLPLPLEVCWLILTSPQLSNGGKIVYIPTSPQISTPKIVLRENAPRTWGETLYDTFIRKYPI